jgi:predicted dehydrogenase
MMQTMRNRPEPGIPRRPRLGFLGVGWIGHHRMNAIRETGLAEIAAIADPSPEMTKRAAELVPDASFGTALDDLLEAELDGVVIATPTALHAQQAIRALECGVAVFCQKPLGRTGGEVRSVVDAARAADRLLAVDFSYRFTEGMRVIRDLIKRRELGRIYAVDLVFHNAYGPDKPWFYDAASSGGGCVMDLGVHLVDLVLWALDFPRVSHVSSTLFAGGERLEIADARVEDYANAALELENGVFARLACSWRLQAGCDAVVSAAFYGTAGGAAFRNVNGSFYNFVAELYRGTQSQTVAAPPDAWGGRAAADWATRLASGERFDPAADQFVAVADALDLIYQR